MLALPPRLDGLGNINPTTAFVNEHKHSKAVCKPLTTMIVDQDHDLSNTFSAIQHLQKKVVQAQREKVALDKASILKLTLPEFLQRVMEVASDKGAWHWLSAMPIEGHGFALAKGSFQDALCLRYGWIGHHHPCDFSALVESQLTQTRLSLVVLVDTQSHATTKSGTLQPVCLTEFAATSQLSAPLSHSLVKLSLVGLPLLRLKPVWM